MRATKITPRQARFVDQYLALGCAAKAAVAAGFSANGAKVTGCRLLARPDLRTLIETRQHQDATRLSVTRENVLQRFLEAFALARENREPAAMVAAMREVAKLMGYYAPVKVEAQVDVGLADTRRRFEAMTDEELLRLVSLG